MQESRSSAGACPKDLGAHLQAVDHHVDSKPDKDALHQIRQHSVISE